MKTLWQKVHRIFDISFLTIILLIVILVLLIESFFSKPEDYSVYE